MADAAEQQHPGDSSEGPTLEDFEQFVAEGSWTTAKTMPEIPHEYVVSHWWRDKTLPSAAIKYIRQAGRRGRWVGGSYKNWYLEHDGWSYWVIWPVINRARLPFVPANEVEWCDEVEARRRAEAEAADPQMRLDLEDE